MIDLLQEARDLKNNASDSRRLGDYDGAVEDLDEAISMLLKEAPPLSDGAAGEASQREIEIVKELSDCYGTMGGVYREWGRLADSTEAYDRGYKYEQHPRFRIVDSYNLVQRLVVRILDRPEVLTRPEVASDNPVPDRGERVPIGEALRRAAHTVREQSLGPRRNDSWCYADLMLTSLLVGDGAAAAAALRDFEALNPSRHAYETTADVLDSLSEKMEGGSVKDSLSRMAADLRAGADSL